MTTLPRAVPNIDYAALARHRWVTKLASRILVAAAGSDLAPPDRGLSMVRRAFEIAEVFVTEAQRRQPPGAPGTYQK